MVVVNTSHMCNSINTQAYLIITIREIIITTLAVLIVKNMCKFLLGGHRFNSNGR
jgi:hypothetical protein